MEGITENTTETTRKSRRKKSGADSNATTPNNEQGNGTTSSKEIKGDGDSQKNTGLEPKIVTVDIEGGNNLEVPQPKKKRETKKSNKNKEDTVKDISTLIQAGSGILSMLLDPCWVMNEIESKAIAKPLVNILERYNLLEKMANVSDGAMLITALGIIVAPRVITTVNNKKNKYREVQPETKEEKRNVKSRKDKTVISKDTGNDRNISGNVSDGNDSQIRVSTIKALSSSADIQNR